MPAELSQIDLAQSEKGAAAGMYFRIPKINESRIVADCEERPTALYPIRQAEKLKELGVRPMKTLPAELVEAAPRFRERRGVILY